MTKTLWFLKLLLLLLLLHNHFLCQPSCVVSASVSSGGGVGRMRREEEQQDQEFRIVDTPDTSTPAPRSVLQHHHRHFLVTCNVDSPRLHVARPWPDVCLK